MKTYKAKIVYLDGQTVITKAEKKGHVWMIGGDVSKATTEMGGKIFLEIFKNGEAMIYELRGCRLKFQDMAGNFFEN